ncbi:MAG: glycosyl hydrolase repeat-containing protein, partial [Gemmatimonadetes bacterium]|nr:glycosyl hydrolase repeat-containing protein [Gemmatimonadota bacterium]
MMPHTPSRTRAVVPAVALALSALLGPLASAGAQGGTDVATFDASRIAAMRYRNIGPARGGRVTAVTGVPQQPATFYFGSTGGGVWKTTDAGLNWKNISEPYFASASIGAIDVADTDPNVIYVGTGSAGIRSNVSIGKGIYKSTDAGKSWKFVGLRDAGQIGRVVVHPTNPDIVYAS